jgi:hypothetical protein
MCDSLTESDSVEDFFESCLSLVGFKDNEFSKLIQDVIELDFVFIFVEVLAVRKIILELIFAF